MVTDIVKELTKGDPRLKSIEDALGSDVADMYDFDCPPLDITMGGGLYSGKIWEVFGYESNGKSTLALEATKAFARYWEAKKFTNYCILYLETESALDKARARWMGAPINSFNICEVECVEDAQDVMVKTLEKCKAKGIKLLIVWDTLAAAPTKSEKEVGKESGMMEKSRVLRKMLREVTQLLGETDSSLILVNQCYIGAGAVPETPGGSGVKFHASVRTHTKVVETIRTIKPNGEEVVVGIEVELNHVKNKLILRQKAKVVLMGETGLDTIETCFRYLRSAKIIDTSGSWSKLQFPEKLYNPDIKDADGKPIVAKMIEASFQSSKNLKTKIESEYAHLKDWIFYLIYQHYTLVSPLVKVKIIKKVWDYELMFFGERRTTLTEQEKEIAKMQFKGLITDTTKEESLLD